MTRSKRIDEGSRLILAPPAAIYRALLDAEARRVWLPPKGMTARIARVDPRAGGGYRMVLTYMDPSQATGESSDGLHVVGARFVELVPEQRVVEAVDFESDDPAFAGTMTMTWSLSSAGGGTDVRVTASDVPVGISAEDHQAGIRSTLENLAAFVE